MITLNNGTYYLSLKFHLLLHPPGHVNKIQNHGLLWPPFGHPLTCCHHCLLLHCTTLPAGVFFPTGTAGFPLCISQGLRLHPAQALLSPPPFCLSFFHERRAQMEALFRVLKEALASRQEKPRLHWWERRQHERMLPTDTVWCVMRWASWWQGQLVTGDQNAKTGEEIGEWGNLRWRQTLTFFQKWFGSG